VRVVAEETEHDEVGVEAVHAVPHVGAVARLRLVEADVLHDLVLALAGDLRVRTNVGMSAALEGANGSR